MNGSFGARVEVISIPERETRFGSIGSGLRMKTSSIYSPGSTRKGKNWSG